MKRKFNLKLTKNKYGNSISDHGLNNKYSIRLQNCMRTIFAKTYSQRLNLHININTNSALYTVILLNKKLNITLRKWRHVLLNTVPIIYGDQQPHGARVNIVV